MLIRDYRQDDRRACLALFDENTPPFFALHERGELEQFLNAPGDYLVVLSEDRCVIGCGGYGLIAESGEARLRWTIVARDWQRQGVGRALLDALCARIANERQATSIGLNTSQHSRPFFERRGFVTERALPNGYETGLHRYDMRLTLAPTAEHR